MIFENTTEVDLINKLLAVVGDEPRNEDVMSVADFHTCQDILRKASASFINRQDRDEHGE
jgi:hypothetical protein